MKRIDMVGNIALLIVVMLIIYLSPNVGNYLAYFEYSKQVSQEVKKKQGVVEERVTLMLRTVDDLGIKDAALKACLKKEADFLARIDPRSTGGRYKADAIDSLNCPGMGIRSVQGLQGVKALKRLTLFQNEIRDISPLAHLHNLESLDLSDNRVVDISALAGLSNLAHLNLAGNRVTNLKPLGEMLALNRLLLPDLSGAFCADVEQLQNLPHIGRSTRLKGIRCKGRMDKKVANILAKDPADWTRKEEEHYLYYRINERKAALNREE